MNCSEKSFHCGCKEERNENPDSFDEANCMICKISICWKCGFINEGCPEEGYYDHREYCYKCLYI